MSRTFWAGVFSVLLVVSVVMGAYSSLTLPQVEGFGSAALPVPASHAAPAPDPVPPISGNTTARPDVTVMMFIGQVFTDYGGSLRVEVRNNDSRDMFLEELAFEWLATGDSSSITVNEAIGAGGRHNISALAIDGPGTPGTHEYRLRLRMLQQRSQNWFRVVSGGDDWLSFSERTIEVLDLSSEGERDVAANTRPYYEKVNGLVEGGSENIPSAADAVTEGLGDGFNMGKACAIFDYLDANLNYTEDEGGDDWQSPDDTLDSMKGDCEDYAMLLASMVTESGGAARVYLTVDHAFAAIFIGNSSEDLANATSDIRGHYRTEVEVHAFLDSNGYWVVADPLGSFNLGGLAVGQSPSTYANGTWETTFEETDLLHSLDVTGDPETLPMWLDTTFWMGMMLLTGFCALGFTVAAMSDRPGAATSYCHICAGEIADEPYICPTCKTTYHRKCAFEKAYCMTCQKQILFPPPPPPVR